MKFTFEEIKVIEEALLAFRLPETSSSPGINSDRRRRNRLARELAERFHLIDVA